MNKKILYLSILLSCFSSIVAIAQDVSTGTAILGSYETHFHYSGDEIVRNRAYNVRKAIRKLNDAILQPDEILSYNHLLGPRTINRGWRHAKTIMNGEIFTPCFLF